MGKNNQQAMMSQSRPLDSGFQQAFGTNTPFDRVGQIAVNTLRVLLSDRLLLRNRREGASHQRWLHVRHGLRSLHLHVIARALACLFLLLSTLLLIARLPENAIPIVHQADRFLHLPTLLQETLAVLRQIALSTYGQDLREVIIRTERVVLWCA